MNHNSDKQENINRKETKPNICSVMPNGSSVVDHGFVPLSGQTKLCKIKIVRMDMDMGDYQILHLDTN